MALLGDSSARNIARVHVHGFSNIARSESECSLSGAKGCERSTWPRRDQQWVEAVTVRPKYS